MKVCLINNLFPPLAVGGAEQVVELLAKGFQENGEVLVITLNSHQKTILENRENLKIYRLSPGNFSSYLNLRKLNGLLRFFWHLIDLFNFFQVNQVKNILLKERPDLVITNNLKGLSYLIPRLIRKLKIKHLHILHDYQLIDPHGSLFRHGQTLVELPWYIKVYSKINRELFNDLPIVVSPSAFVLNKHLEYGFFKESKKQVLANPILSGNCSISEKDRSISFTILYLGQLEEHKGIEFLMNTFALFNQENVELLVAGDGSLLTKLKSANNDQRIKFLDKVDHCQLQELFNKVDLTIVPSLWWENSPTVVYESYAAGRPVLVSNSGGTKELVEEGKTGHVFKTGDQADLLEKLNHLYNQRHQLKNLGLAGQNLAKTWGIINYLVKLQELCQD